MLTIGIDAGTQSAKAVVLDVANGQVLATAKRSYDLIPGLPTGHMEQHPEEWMSATVGCVDECLMKIGGRRSEIRAIGVSGQQHGMVMLGADDKPVRPAKLWCDTSTVDQCAQFLSEFGGDEGLVKLAGNTILPGYTIPKILWLKQNEPDNFAKSRSLLLPHDYLNFRLTGVKRMEYGDASGTGILDIRTRTWCGELVDFVDPRVRDMLPPVGSSLMEHGKLTPDWKQRWNLPQDVSVSAGGGDNMMGAIGTGNIAAGVITLSLGTSGTVFGVSGHPVTDPRGEVAGFCDSADQWLPLVCTMNVTVATEQLRKMFGWDIPELEAAVARAPAGAGGILFLPYLSGERTPNLPGGSGVYHGLNLQNMTPSHMARATVEGVTLGLAYGMNRFREMGVSPSEIRVTGGGSHGPAWRQIVADIFQTPVVGFGAAEGASSGAALQAAALFGESLASLCKRNVELDENTRVEPDTDLAALYAERLHEQTRLTASLRDNQFYS